MKAPIKYLLLTGSTGFVGTNLLLKSLLNCKFICLVRGKSDDLNFNDDNSNFLKVNINEFKLNATSILAKLGIVQIDGIVHLATHFTMKPSLEEISNLVEANVTLGTWLLEFSLANNISFFINLSTFSVRVSTEQQIPQSLYASTKAAFEQILDYYASSSEVQIINLELFDTYGPNDTRSKFINLLATAIKNKDAVFNMSAGGQQIALIHVYDVVAAINLLIQNENRRVVYNQANYSLYPQKITTLLEVAQQFIKDTKSDIILNPGFYPYRNREIMVINPRFQLLPNWFPKHSLNDYAKQLSDKI